MTGTAVKYCQNCGTELHGEYCSSCGQRDKNLNIPVKELASEFVEIIPSFDQRLIRTMKPFLFKPGLLVLEYLSGKRKKYISPYKLYFFVSVVFFFISALRNIDYETVKKENSILQGASNTPSPDDSASITLRDKNSGIGFSINDTSAAKEVLGSGFLDGFREMKKNPKLLFDTIKEHRPKIIFVLLPIFALLLKVAYGRSTLFYIQHLVFTFYFYSFIFLILIIVNLLQMIQWNVVQTYSAALYLLIPCNLYLGLKRVYDQSHGKTFIKFILVSASSVIVFYLVVAVAAIVIVVFIYL